MHETRPYALFVLPAAWPMATSAWQPQVDIYRSRDGWVVKVELAGVRPQDVSLTTHGSRLRVAGVRHDGSVEAGWRHYAMEIAYNRFERTIDLPCDLQHARITVEYRDGMLLLRVVSNVDQKVMPRRFGRFVAVDALTLAVEAGEVFALLGANGAGKTVTLKMLTTLLPPTSGTARVAGCDIVHQAASVRRVIGYVPQMVSADGTLTGYENMLISAKLYDIPRAERQARLQETLQILGLTDVAQKLVRAYSGGMIRRLEMGQAMLHHPRVLFLDEPTVGLDPLARRTVWERLEHLCAQEGTTVVFTAHLMDEADRQCSRVAMLHRGTVAALGTPATLKATLGGEAITLDDVFVHYAGGVVEEGGEYRETARTRRTAQRLG